MIELITMPILNRFAGGGMFLGKYWDTHRPNKLPGRALYPATALVTLVVSISASWQLAFAFATAFIVWRSPAWGYLISLGHDSPATRRGPNWFEGLLMSMA